LPPLGEHPELAAKGLRVTGSWSYGGLIVTASGVVFTGATNYSKKLRAFDQATGKLLWETVLSVVGNATPMTYQIGGRQFAVIAAGEANEAESRAVSMRPSLCCKTNRAWRSMTEPYYRLVAEEWLKLLIGAREAKRDEKKA
jgi:outer membrane protein assembly factor BamB